MTVPDRWGDRLPRRLGLWSAVAVVVGSTIGSGIFRTPASIAQRVDDVPLFLLGWVLGGGVALAGALTYAELAALFPAPAGSTSSSVKGSASFPPSCLAGRSS